MNLDINQSSDLVQWSEREQLQNGKTAVSGSLILVPIGRAESRKRCQVLQVNTHLHKDRQHNLYLTNTHARTHTQLCPLVTVQIPSNNLHLAQTLVVVEGWRMNREGGISWGSSWLPAGPQNCRIIGMQRWMWQRPQMYRGWQNRGGIVYTASELVAWLPCSGWLPPREGTRLCVLEVNLASFLAYISPRSAVWDFMKKDKEEWQSSSCSLSYTQANH